MIIPGFDKYDITEDGVVTKIDTGKILKPYVYASHKGTKYMHVSLVDPNSGLTGTYSVIRLLAITYLAPRPPHHVACAKDGNNLNAVLSNVEWRDRAVVARMSSNPNRKKRRSMHCNEETKAMVLGALKSLDKCITASELAIVLEVPYSTARYSILELLKENKVKKTTKGYEVVK